MVGFQKTFSLIPELPSAAINGKPNVAPVGPPSRPPMTTKQAKKAYKAANKGPKISKAEQRRQDLMEQDRIRRELEKERNQARARTARDRRKEKEEKEKAEKKKKGLPLVAVNPSQDTLARFMLRPAPKKTEKRIPLPALEDGDSDATSSARDEEVRSAKRRRLDEPPTTLERKPDPSQSIFKRPGSGEVDQSQKKSCLGSLNVPRKESPTPGPHIYDLDDPSNTAMVEDQISNESFSVDDGLFDDLVFESFELETTVGECSDTHQALPPTKPPDNGDCFIAQNEPEAGEGTSVATPQFMNPCPPSLSAKHGEHEKCPQSQSFTSVRIGVEQTITLAGSSPHHDATERIFAASRFGGATEHPTACNKPENFLSTIVTNPPDDSAGIENAARVFKQDLQTDVQVPATQQTLPAQAASLRKVQPTEETHRSVPRPKLKRESWTPRIRQPLQDMSLNNVGFSKAMDLLPSKFPDKCQSAANTSHSLSPLPNFPISRAKTFLSPRTPAMAPPPLPPKFKSPSRPASSYEASGPKFLLERRPLDFGETKQSNPPSLSEQSAPPLSTQALLESLSDLFPSPSQEVKEIFENSHSREQWSSAGLRFPPRATQFGSLTGGNQPGHYTPSILRHHARKSPIRRAQVTGKQSSDLVLTRKDSIAVSATTSSKPCGGNVIDCMPFLSTQDLYLSSQDIKEMEECVVVPGKGQESADASPTSENHLQVPMSHLTPAPEASVRSCVITNEACTTPPREERGSRTSDDKRPSTPVETPLITEEDIEELLKYDDDGSQDRSTNPTNRPALEHQPPDLSRQSPKPFFTSSGNKEMMYLAIERIKTTAWESDHVRHKAQEDLQRLLRAEEEKADRLLLERMLQKEEEVAAAVPAGQPFEAAIDAVDAMVCQPCELERRKPPSSLPQSQKSKGNGQRGQRRSQPQSSWDKMLGLLAKTGNDQAVPALSQESDYGDAPWDDVDLGLVGL